MNWKAHFAIGFVLSLIVFYLLNPDLYNFSSNLYKLFIFSFFAAGCALLPDMDCITSKARGIVNKLIIFIAIIFVYFFYCSDYNCIFSENFLIRVFAFSGIGFLILLYVIPKHRGIMHSFLFGALFSIFIYFILGSLFALAGAIGYFSHLFADWEIKLI